MRADLKATMEDDREETRIPYCDKDGLVADFHSLRHTFITNLARSNVHPSVARTLARHCDINLTMARYSHVELGRQSDAVAALPDVSPQPEATAVAVAEGEPVLDACLDKQDGQAVSKQHQTAPIETAETTEGGSDEGASESPRRPREAARAWRRGRDSNPRTPKGQRFSKPPLSSTQPPLRGARQAVSVPLQDLPPRCRPDGLARHARCILHSPVGCCHRPGCRFPAGSGGTGMPVRDLRPPRRPPGE
jgi:hypothetical protein